MFNFNKNFGQNFISDEKLINKIVDSENIDKDTLVIEVGPGMGALTKKIVPLAKFSVIYEIDDRLEESLITIQNPFKPSSNIDLTIGIQKNSQKNYFTPYKKRLMSNGLYLVLEAQTKENENIFSKVKLNVSKISKF